MGVALKKIKKKILLEKWSDENIQWTVKNDSKKARKDNDFIIKSAGMTSN